MIFFCAFFYSDNIKCSILVRSREGRVSLKQLSPLERAVEYIEEHLNENIGLSDVSRETGILTIT